MKTIVIHFDISKQVENSIEQLIKSKASLEKSNFEIGVRHKMQGSGSRLYTLDFGYNYEELSLSETVYSSTYDIFTEESEQSMQEWSQFVEIIIDRHIDKIGAFIAEQNNR